ncbi:hypothetical protein EON63_05750 [archaeon]|nr:MAG: hypothetical protein EON63_05750 [archaeon]
MARCCKKPFAPIRPLEPPLSPSFYVYWTLLDMSELMVVPPDAATVQRANALKDEGNALLTQGMLPYTLIHTHTLPYTTITCVLYVHW